MGEEKIKIIINGKSVIFGQPCTILQALKSVEIKLPSPCCHSYLNSTHHCGLCVVSVKFPGKDFAEIVQACTTSICNDMEINTEDLQVKKSREAIIDNYLLSHALDCSLCDKVGDCFLHKFAINTHFRGFTRITGRHYNNRELVQLGDKISIDRAQCTLCGRCLHFCNDVLGEDILGKIKNEENVDVIATYPGRSCNNNYSLNLIDLCPVGAIVANDQDTDHPAWGLQSTPSISPESSVGINTYVLHNSKHVFRIIPRENERINQTWMTDSARELYKIQTRDDRILYPQQSGEKADIILAASRVANTLLQSTRGVYVVFSGEMSMEDQFVLKRFLDVVGANQYFVKRTVPGDGFLISDDPYPNTTGASLMRLSTATNTYPDLSALYELIEKGQCSTIISVYEDIFADSPKDGLFDNVKIIYIGYRKNRTSQVANFVFPVTTIFEKTGTFINKDYILQKFFKAINPPKKAILDCWGILSLLTNCCFQGEDKGYASLGQIWKDMVYVVPELKDIDFKSIPLDGLSLKK